ncbi:unnamed protein product [Cyclocybe aegerita]|uniref:DUF6593 domain-containing protein n=1 Tax=Cyclocybe aegerita TaxID=1973307 RepID=A0A8S0WIR5_CYCAE|nr:unnamed protein product [Cyclocybe aegerita]
MSSTDLGTDPRVEEGILHTDTAQGADEFDSESWIGTPTSSRPPTYISDAQSFNDDAYTDDTGTIYAGPSTSSLVHLRPPSILGVDETQEAITYTFTPTSPIGNSLTLLPPEGAREGLPRFHIVVTPNVFNPFQQITSIYRGETQFGEWVASFEMGISSLLARVRIHRRDRVLNNVLEKDGIRHKAVWTWTSPSKNVDPFIWDCKDSKLASVCKSANDKKKILATYTPARSMLAFAATVTIDRRGEEVELSKLEVTPEGHRIFEDILVSLLIIQRKRMLAREHDPKPYN